MASGGADIRIAGADLAALQDSTSRMAATAAALGAWGGMVGAAARQWSAQIKELRELYDALQRAFGADVDRPATAGARRVMTAAQGVVGGAKLGVAAGVMTLNPIVGAVVGGAGMVGGAILGAGEANRLRDLERQLQLERNRQTALEQHVAHLRSEARPWIEHQAALRRAREQ